MPDDLSITEIIKLLSSHYSIPEILIKSLFNLNGRSNNFTQMQQIPGGQQQQQTVSDDKCFIENLESEIIEFIVKPNVDSWKLTPLNSYYRLLTHKVSEYYNLGHILSNDGYSMVLYKINTSLVNADDETKKTAKFDEDGNIKPLDFRNLKFDPAEKLNRIRLSELYSYYGEMFKAKVDESLSKQQQHRTPQRSSTVSSSSSVDDLTQGVKSSLNINANTSANSAHFKIMKRKPGSKSRDTVFESSAETGDTTPTTPIVEEKTMEEDKISREEKYRLVKERLEKEQADGDDDDDDDDDEDEDDYEDEGETGNKNNGRQYQTTNNHNRQYRRNNNNYRQNNYNNNGYGYNNYNNNYSRMAIPAYQTAPQMTPGYGYYPQPYVPAYQPPFKF
ncbi:unnamed protein product [Ambrosiozyma monospora]|uniref:Unnamed protein product n=1 Tax=Ambrosiozyma monospora TaxID=43982 RepID=A0ACB5TBG9_AMBMO|nr:unnamed protein product [Ambrosiozyma monospora]